MWSGKDEAPPECGVRENEDEDHDSVKCRQFSEELFCEKNQRNGQYIEAGSMRGGFSSAGGLRECWCDDENDLVVGKTLRG